MYEQMRAEFLTKLSETSLLSIQNVLSCLDLIMNNYSIQKKEVSLSVDVFEELPEMVKMYLVVKKMAGLSDGTLDNYHKILDLFFKRVRKSPENVKPNDIRVFLYEYQQIKKVSSRTLDKYREYICRFFNWACEEGYLSTNPAKSITPIKHETKPRQALTQIELEYLRDACKDDRESAVLEVLYSTGCRVSELIGLKIEDIDWNSKTVHLFGKNKKHRTSFLNARAEVALKKYLNSRSYKSPYVFCQLNEPHDKLTRSGAETIFHSIVSNSVISNKHITPHTIRHTTATLALQHGMPITDIQMLLGHESVNTTMIYAETSTENVQNGHKKYVI